MKDERQDKRRQDEREDKTRHLIFAHVLDIFLFFHFFDDSFLDLFVVFCFFYEFFF